MSVYVWCNNHSALHNYVLALAKDNSRKESSSFLPIPLLPMHRSVHFSFIRIRSSFLFCTMQTEMRIHHIINMRAYISLSILLMWSCRTWCHDSADNHWRLLTDGAHISLICCAIFMRHTHTLTHYYCVRDEREKKNSRMKTVWGLEWLNERARNIIVVVVTVVFYYCVCMMMTTILNKCCSSHILLLILSLLLLFVLFIVFFFSFNSLFFISSSSCTFYSLSFSL